MPYAERTDVEQIFGASNVSKWADVDNDQNAEKIEARIAWAIGLSEEKLNNRLRGGPYTVPFGGDAIPAEIVDAAARLAGVLLYDSRGVTDFDPNGKPMHQLSAHRDMVDKFIAEVHANRVTLDITSTKTTAPAVVNGHRSRRIC